MITEQLEFFPIKIKKTSSVIVRQSSSVYFREWNDIVASIAKNFSVADRKYYAGMIDGDGSFNFRIPKDAKNFKATMSLELRYDHAEPVTKLAELFDLTVRKITRLYRENTKDTLKTELGGIKCKLFMFSIYPYLLEKKNIARNILLKLDCPEKHLSKRKKFSFEYLAGYTDAEGHIRFVLRHEKRNTKTYSSYKMFYQLTSNDNAHLQFIKQKLIKKGFNHFRKDVIDTHKNVKVRENRNPEKWKDTTHIYLGGTPGQLSTFYKNIKPFMLIKHKKENINHTIMYDRICKVKINND